jgi:formamidopyrimidine-DNA glycosylase
MTKIDAIQKERARLAELFKNVETGKTQLVEKLLDQAAYLAIENEYLQEVLVETGMIKIHPQHKGMQKAVEGASQYRQNVNSYAVLVKTMNSILTKDITPGEDPFEDFIKEHQRKSESRKV